MLIIIALSRDIFLEETMIGEGVWGMLQMNINGSVRIAQN